VVETAVGAAVGAASVVASATGLGGNDDQPADAETSAPAAMAEPIAEPSAS
jgi:hypothetical protein